MNFIKDIFNFNRKDSTEKVFDSLYNIIIKTELSIDYDVNWDMRNVNSIHPFSLASLAIYRQMAKKKIECVNIAPKMKEYFNMTHFNKPLAVEYAMEELGAYNGLSYLPICQFDLHKNNIDNIQCVLQQLILEQSKATEELKTPLSYILSELICNMTQHSRGKNGYLFSHYSQTEKCISLVLSDDGITILGSYIENKKCMEEVGENDAVALRFACEGKSTKNLPFAESRGYGLSSSKKMLVECLHGSFFLLSGRAFHSHDTSGITYIKLPHCVNWDGTAIFMKMPTVIPKDFNYIKYIG